MIRTGGVNNESGEAISGLLLYLFYLIFIIPAAIAWIFILALPLFSILWVALLATPLLINRKRFLNVFEEAETELFEENSFVFLNGKLIKSEELTPSFKRAFAQLRDKLIPESSLCMCLNTSENSNLVKGSYRVFEEAGSDAFLFSGFSDQELCMSFLDSIKEIPRRYMSPTHRAAQTFDHEDTSSSALDSGQPGVCHLNYNHMNYRLATYNYRNEVEIGGISDYGKQNHSRSH